MFLSRKGLECGIGRLEKGLRPHSPSHSSLLAHITVSHWLRLLPSHSLTKTFISLGKTKTNSTIPHLQFQVLKSLKVKRCIFVLFCFACGFGAKTHLVTKPDLTGCEATLSSHLLRENIHLFTAEIVMGPVKRCCPRPHWDVSEWRVPF